jgi:hypothetical protein
MLQLKQQQLNIIEKFGENTMSEKEFGAYCPTVCSLNCEHPLFKGDVEVAEKRE